MAGLLDNNFQSRYFKLPIATHVVKEPPHDRGDAIAPFVLKHYHKEFEVIGVISGSCDFIIDHNTYKLEKGDLLLIPPYSLHYGNALPGDAHSHFCFCFDLSLLQSEYLEKNLETGTLDVTRRLSHCHPDTAFFYEIARLVYQQCESMPTGWEYVVRGQLLTLFGMLEQKNLLITKLKEKRQDEFGLNVLNILSQRYGQNISSNDIAASLSYSQSYFCRKFHDAFGLTFQQYLSQYRLSRARLFLSQKNLSVEEVARRVGFNHVGYFTRQFHEAYGCTPKQFQKNQVKAANFQTYYRSSDT